jgi:hypothetical protein
MFKIARSNVILWPVAINLPVDGGEMQKVETTVKFRRMPDDDYMAIVDKYRSPEGKPPVDANQFNVSVLREIVADWPDLADENGEPLAYTPEHLERMVRGEDGQFISQGLFEAYNEIRFGSRQKN